MFKKLMSVHNVNISFYFDLIQECLWLRFLVRKFNTAKTTPLHRNVWQYLACMFY